MWATGSPVQSILPFLVPGDAPPNLLAVFGIVTGTVAALAAAFAIYNILRDRARIVIRRVHSPSKRLRTRQVQDVLLNWPADEILRVYTIRVTNRGRRPAVIEDASLWIYTAAEGAQHLSLRA